MFTKTKIILAAGLFTVSGSAIAQNIELNENAERVMTVPYGDLNLDSVQGQNALQARIRGAVRKVCGHSTSNLSVREQNKYRTCARQANSSALAALETRGNKDEIRIAVRSAGQKTATSN